MRYRNRLTEKQILIGYRAGLQIGELTEHILLGGNIATTQKYCKSVDVQSGLLKNIEDTLTLSLIGGGLLAPLVFKGL